MLGKDDVKKAKVVKQPFYKGMFFQIVTAMVLGIIVGWLWPAIGSPLKPFVDGFIKLIKMVIAPVVFGVVVVGIAKVGDIKKVGRIGGKTILYFEVVTSIALVIGMLVANIYHPGMGLNIDPTKLSEKDLLAQTKGAQIPSTAQFILHMIPDSIVGAFANNELLQVLLFSLLFGFALLKIKKERADLIINVIEHFNEVIFKIIGFIMKLSVPVTFAAMAYSIGLYGTAMLISFGRLIFAMVLASFIFLIILHIIVRVFGGIGLWQLIRYIKEEIIIAAATGSSEVIMPRLMAKFEHAGCHSSVVGLVVPTGYTFNLDGATLYLSLSVVFLAQALNINMNLTQQVTLVGILMLTSKGMAGIPGSAYVALTASASATGMIPAVAVTLMFGPDQFMGKIRTFVNIMGYSVATFIVARWEGLLDLDRARDVLTGQIAELSFNEGEFSEHVS
ncbi:cation:dicarboxylase symporter family transporter [Desulfosporosinus sp. PR]|uniref:cation:dicarboxylate symporter family transporter n=1 Tax=Candidatus Desulfosporosinus nitrosoreducens TaxID=3401928 RepID=UPI0027F41DA0|nr:cation:dicarboxylase symporter family transporter [Desulfosporosinus sp. PR]MDQ7092644.1 cation:dicarboxylase symporter family transporter [Desulfosporosinus sp. PR]